MDNQKLKQNKLKQFDDLHKTYLKTVSKEYDKRNKGPYFHYDEKINCYQRGIERDNGGKELITSGRDLISRAMLLYLPEFQNLSNKVNEISESNNFVTEPLVKVMSNLTHIANKLQEVKESSDRFYDCSSFDLYSHMKGFSMYGGVEEIPMEYIWRLGEMVFHQIRIEEINNDSNRTCRNLDEILQNMHVSSFEDKKPELGKELVRELLSVHYDLNEFHVSKPLPAMQAQTAIRKYRITDERLCSAADQMLILQANKYAEYASVKRTSEAIKDANDKEQNKILKGIGIKSYHS